jgi:hypothetical protein
MIANATAKERDRGEAYRVYQRSSSEFTVVAQNRAPLQDYDNYDLTGTDLRILQGIDVQACSTACRVDNQCQAYSFDKWHSRCSLKATLGSLRFEPSAIAGLAPNATLPPGSNAPWSMQRLQGRSFSTTASRSEQMPTYDQCERTCQNEQSCVALSYSNREQACRLFQTISGYSTDQDTDSAIKHQNTDDASNHPQQAEPPLAPAIAPQLQATAPASSVSPQKVIKRVKQDVSLGYLNLRSGPGQNYDVVTRVPAGAGGVIFSGRCATPHDGKSAFPFCLVEWSGHVGWISSNGLE